MSEENNIHGKSLARLIAVQGLYSHEISGGSEDVEDLLERLVHVQVDKEDEDDSIMQNPDRKLLRELIVDCTKNKKDIDGIITKYLKPGWGISRLDVLLLSIIRPAIYELKEKKKTPVKVIFDEYVNIAHSFYDLQEVGFVNGILDSVAHELRPEEMTSKNG